MTGIMLTNTLTVLAIFLPMVFLKGMVGINFRPFA